ncbi:MAG TPA: acetylxylan esterase [Chitinophagaceae bacterium]|nr:acetylxylan esterase [Chitinophagaceae bacterium]
MKLAVRLPYKKWLQWLILYMASLLVGVNVVAQDWPAEKVRQDFIALLARPATDRAPSFTVTVTDSVEIERGYFFSAPNEKVPVLIYRPKAAPRRWPVVVCLHGTGGSKDDAGIKSLLMQLVHAGFMAVSIDGRYHGERGMAAAGHNRYEEAIISAWRQRAGEPQAHPFFYDTVYDVWKLLDYLQTRSDIDTTRMGMMGISKGGIETWMAASVDRRIKVAVPVISVQSFAWSLSNDRWQGRANTIRTAHLAVAKDLGDTVINKENVQRLWNKIVPGITGEFDCPSMLRLFAPRPLLILNTANDANCPLPGAKIAYAATLKAYKTKQAQDKLKMDIAPQQPHVFTPLHQAMAIEWFKRWL